MRRITPALLAFGAVSSFSMPGLATTYQVGPTRTYKTLQAVVDLLGPGDRVEVDGNATYSGGATFNNAGAVVNPITIIGIPISGKRPVLSGGANTVAFVSGDPYTSGADHYVLQGFEITGGSSRCIFHQAGDLTVRDVAIHDCPAQGLLGADQGSGSLVLEYSEVYNCGSGTQSHQIYMSSDETNRPGSVFRMQFNYVHDGKGGNNVKSRAERNEIYYNWIEGGYYREIELIGCDPGGGCSEGDAREDSDVVGNVFVKRNNNAGVVRFGGDGTGQSWGRYRFVNNTVVSGSDQVFWLYDGLESLELDNNVFYQVSGSPSIAPLTDATWLTGSATFAGTHNWIKTGASSVPAGLTGTLSGSDPGLQGVSANNMLPTAASPLVNAGANVTVGPSGHVIPNPLPLPLFEPPAHAALAVGTAQARPVDTIIDIGAFEYVVACTLGTDCTTPPGCHTASSATCTAGVCGYPVTNGAACDDGDGCTTLDGTCNSSGVCVAGPNTCSSTSCGDGVCNGVETCATCPEDCTPAGQVCCSGALVTGTCCSGSQCTSPSVCTSHQCQAPPATCGNHTCDTGETCGNCPQDCGASAGQVCCGDALQTGNCCANTDCASDEACQAYACQAVAGSGSTPKSTELVGSCACDSRLPVAADTWLWTVGMAFVVLVRKARNHLAAASGCCASESSRSAK